MTDPRRMEVEQVLDTLRPAMTADGGNVELVTITNGSVVVRLIGACTMCPSAELTLRRGIEPTLKRALPWVTEIRAAGK